MKIIKKARYTLSYMFLSISLWLIPDQRVRNIMETSLRMGADYILEDYEIES